MIQFYSADKHDQETLTKLVVAKKEVEALNVTVTQMEEERETKGSQQLGNLEGRFQSFEVTLKCVKLLAENQSPSCMPEATSDC